MKIKIKLLLLFILCIFQMNVTSAYIQGCDVVENNIVKYDSYQNKIDTFFTTVWKKEREVQEKVYKKLQSKLTHYLDIIDKNKQEKAYTVLLYMSCIVQEKYLHILHEEGNSEVNLELVLTNVKKKAETYKFTTIRTVRWKIFFDWPMHVVDSELHEMSLSQFEELLWNDISLKDVLDNNWNYWLLSVFIKNNFLFLKIRHNLAWWTFDSYIVINQWWKTRGFRGIHEVQNMIGWKREFTDRVVLLDWSDSQSNKSHILDTRNEVIFRYVDSIDDLQWFVKDTFWMAMVELSNRFWVVGDMRVYDFQEWKYIELDDRHWLEFFWMNLNILYHNHKIYKIIGDPHIKEACTIQQIILSNKANKITFWKEETWFCQQDWFFSYNFSYIWDYQDWLIYNYYDNIEKQNLVYAFGNKYYEWDNFNEGLNTFKKLYTFDEYVEINVTDMVSLWWSKLKYVVELKYEGWTYEKYEVTSEIISWMIAQIKTLSVIQLR